MTQCSTMGEWLATLDRSRLAEIIGTSPLAQAGSRLRSIGELAQRLSHPANVARTLHEVPLPVLEIVEAASALGEAATVAALAEILDPAGADPAEHAQRVAFWLTEAQRAALLWLDEERLRINPGFDAMVSEPLAIGRPARSLLASQDSDSLARILGSRGVTVPARKAERLASALAAFADPPASRQIVAGAPTEVFEAFTTHVSQRLSRAHCVTTRMPVDDVYAAYDAYAADDRVDVLDRDAYQRARDRGEWEIAAGLAVDLGVWGYLHEAEMPSEVYLALAPPSFRAPFHAEPPRIAVAPVAREQVQRGSAAALAHFVAAAATIFEDVARNGLLALKRGGVGARELTRVAKQVGEDTPTVRLALELGLRLALFDLRDDGRIGASSRFGPWRRRPPHQQAFDLVSQWMHLEYAPTAERDEAGAALPALGRDGVRSGLPNGLLLTMTIASATSADVVSEADVTPSIGATRHGVTSGEEIVDLLMWGHPMARSGAAVFTRTWAEASLLGIVADGVAVPLAEAIAADDEVAALAILREILPAHSVGAMFGSDLTVVVPGNPAPDIVDVLEIVAVRESHGAANTWRADPASVRSALDSGYAAVDLVEALRGIGGGTLPQTWEYLIGDTARRHGRLRVSGASAVITCRDEALLAEAVASRALRALGLSLVAPTVAISYVDPVETLRRLREAGYLPVEVNADGAPVTERRPVPRRADTSAAVVPQQDGSTTDVGAQDADNVVPLFAGATSHARPSGEAETADDLAARLLSDNPDSNRGPDEVGDIAEVERQIASVNRRLSPAEVHELADAETRVRPVMIRYRSQSGRDSVRTVSHLNLVGDSLFAYCHLREADRVFRLDRIIEVAPVY